MWVWTLKLSMRKEREIKTLLKGGGDTASLSLRPGETKKCSWFLVLQANGLHMCYSQLVSNVTRSLQNHPLLGIKTVTYQVDSRTKSCAFHG